MITLRLSFVALGRALKLAIYFVRLIELIKAGEGSHGKKPFALGGLG